MGIDLFDGLKIGLELLWSILTADPLLTLLIVVFFGSLLSVVLIVDMYREIRLKKSGVLEVDKMSEKKFEEYFQVFLKAKGYHAQLTPASGDYGADLILSIKDKKIIVQAKRYKRNLGIRAVQEIATAKSYYKADEC